MIYDCICTVAFIPSLFIGTRFPVVVLLVLYLYHVCLIRQSIGS